VVNVVNHMTLHRLKDCPHGLHEIPLERLSTDHVEVVFGFHGYPEPAT